MVSIGTYFISKPRVNIQILFLKVPRGNLRLEDDGSACPARSNCSSEVGIYIDATTVSFNFSSKFIYFSLANSKFYSASWMRLNKLIWTSLRGIWSYFNLLFFTSVYWGICRRDLSQDRSLDTSTSFKATLLCVKIVLTCK